MSCATVMKTLKSLGSAQTAMTLTRHGAGTPLFGVSYAALYKLQKQLAPDTALAKALWATGNHDARILATLICDPSEFTSRDLDAWHKDVDNYVVNGAVADVVSRSPHALKKADVWRKSKGEWRSAAGWSLVAALADPDRPTEDDWLRERLAEIEAAIDDAPNRTRHSMNQALIAIGGYRPSLRAAAVAAAKRIGTVEVDHGDTSCKTPAAIPYIKKMVARQAKKKASRTKRAATR